VDIGIVRQFAKVAPKLPSGTPPPGSGWTAQPDGTSLTASEVLKRGLKFTAFGQFATYGIRFGSNLILTRLLAPDYFGVMAVAILFVYAATMLCDVGLRSAIIAEKRADDARFRNIVWSVMVFRIVALVALISAFSFTIKLGVTQGWLSTDSTYADPRLNTALFLLTLTSIFSYLESVEIVYRERLMEFHTLLKIDLIRQVISTAVTLIWAWQSPSIVALLAGGIVANACITVGSYVWLAKAWPTFIWSPEDFKFLWSRGKWLWVSAILTFSMSVVDRLVLARYFDATQMGLYSIAWLYCTIILDLVVKFTSSVVFPLTSHSFREGDRDLWKTYYKGISIVVKVALPAGFLFLTFGDKLIELLYDQRYNPAGPLLRAFGFIAFLTVYLPAGEVYVALGQAKIKSIIYVLRLVTLVAALVALLPAQGLMGGILALIASQGVGAIASLYYNRRLGLFHRRHEASLLAMIAILIAASFGIRALLF
jgi:O-antigen/teichoic acid export membrane protein